MIIFLGRFVAGENLIPLLVKIKQLPPNGCPVPTYAWGARQNIGAQILPTAGHGISGGHGKSSGNTPDRGAVCLCAGASGQTSPFLAPRRARAIQEFRGHHTHLRGHAFLPPGLPGRRLRPNRPSIAPTNGSRPKGRPLRLWRRTRVSGEDRRLPPVPQLGDVVGDAGRHHRGNSRHGASVLLPHSRSGV